METEEKKYLCGIYEGQLIKLNEPEIDFKDDCEDDDDIVSAPSRVHTYIWMVFHRYIYFFRMNDWGTTPLRKN